ncbi:MAG: hypothetical protein IAI48_03975, partial [Candidatus Eremiobacteraeota bacterium]|nr:hypothetical protein [Candidatus Eremiobacteraeota bacterium]
ADGPFASVLLALELGALALRGPSGLVHPRLLPLVALGAVATTLRAARTPRTAGGFRGTGVPALMLAALVAGSPPPAYTATETTVAGGFAGETVAFTGTARRGDRGTTRLVRYAITCCRIDATAVALPLDRRLRVRDGSWIAITGIFVARGDGLVLRVDAWRALAPPPDPFVYR